MDAQAIYRVFVDEKRILGINLSHATLPYSGPAGVSGAQFLGSEDVFQVFVEGRTIRLYFHKEKISRISDREGRLMIRKMLCHVLDHLDGKIGHEFFGFLEEGEKLLDYALLNAVLAESQKAYYEFLVAKRYIKIFGIEEFEEQNEIKMNEFIELINSHVEDFQKQQNRLLAYTLFGAIFGVIKEVIKVNFYNPRDLRFSVGMWQIVEWLTADFEFLEQSHTDWRKTSALVSFEGLVILENIEAPTILTSTLLKLKERPSWKTFTDHDRTTVLPKTLVERWMKRVNLLPLHLP